MSRNLPRRELRVLPAQSPQWVLVEVMREVLDPAWAAGTSAERLAGRVHDAQSLRRARARLRTASRERTTGTQQRALTTLDLAIEALEGTTTEGLMPPVSR